MWTFLSVPVKRPLLKRSAQKNSRISEEEFHARRGGSVGHCSAGEGEAQPKVAHCDTLVLPTDEAVGENRT